MAKSQWIVRVLMFSMLLPILLPCIVSAQWIPDGSPVCTALLDQSLQQMTSDLSGGAIIVWQDLRDGRFDIYAQRIDADGYPLWISDGIPICTYESGRGGPMIVSDGAGGAIIVYSDNRNGRSEIFGQRIDGSGATLWAADGVRVSEIFYNASKPQIASDGVGGAIVSYTVSDISSPPYGVYVKSIDSNGNPRCCDAGLASGEAHQIISDGAGGAIITWAEFVDDFGGSWDIRAQRVDTAGSTYWGTGVSVAYGPVKQTDPQIVSDGSGGAVITWVNQTNWQIYAQRIDPDGNLLWTLPTGVDVSTSPAHQEYPQLTTDDAGGAIIAWWDTRLGWWGVYAQNVDATGSLLWDPDGIAVCTVAGEQHSIKLAPDDNGGAIITWEDHRSEVNQGIYAQRVDSDGNPLWTSDGVALCTAANDQTTPQLIPTSGGGAIVSWTDPRDGDYDIYAQRIYADECEVDPASLDFGTVAIGGHSDLTFEITNAAGFGTFSGSVGEYCSQYSIVSGMGAYSLSPGESWLVTVRFEPWTTGTHPCTILTGIELCTDVSCTGVGGCLTGILYVDADASGVGDGSSWIDAFDELRDALLAAEICTGITEIWVAEGTYTPTGGSVRSAAFVLQNDLALYGGFDGTETLLSERDFTAHPTILSGEIGAPGSSDNSYHVVKASNTNSSAVLDGFTVTGGNADGTDNDGNGGGMILEDGSPTVANVRFYLNTALGFGAGLYIYGGSPTLTNVTFEGNSADASGGGMYNYGGNPILTNVTFDANSATGLGGGVYNSAGEPTLINVVFTDNSASSGGGMYSIGLLIGTLTNVTFGGNSASTQGGGMGNSFSLPIMTNVIMWGDTAPTGPEIHIYKGSPTISYSLIQGCGGSGAGWDTSLGTDGGNNIDADPQFKGAYSPNTPLAVWSSSPAIDAGDNTAVPGWITTDIDGNPRVYNGVVDMGAYEHQGLQTGIDGESLPKVTALRSVYPNPFNPVVTVKFDLDRRRNVQLMVYDVSGRLVRVLVEGVMEPGWKSITWDGYNDTGMAVASGVYFCRLVAGDFVQTRKMVLLR